MRRAVIVLLAVVVLSSGYGLVSGCGALRRDPHIVGYGGDQAGAMGITDAKSHQPYLSNDMVICLDRPGDAFITDVVPLRPRNGLTVTAFAAVPRIAMNGGITTETGSTIADVTSTPSREVTQKCPPATEKGLDGAQYGYTLMVQFMKPDDRSAWDDGVRLSYTSSGRRYSTDLHFQVALCTPGDSAPTVDNPQICN
jgi:hypothetical protein